MHGDYSRNTFDAANGFTRVLMQQGRLIVDADWNEQQAILLTYLHTLAADLIGWHGGPGVSKDVDNAPTAGAFIVSLSAEKKVMVTGGRYYINGLLLGLSPKEEGYEAIEINRESELPNRIVFVDVWEQHVSAASDPSLPDPALKGLDSCDRGRLRIQFRVLFSAIDKATDVPTVEEEFRQIEVLRRLGGTATPLDNRRLYESKRVPRLSAWTNISAADDDSCDEDVSAGYTGLENQLYRVEVHGSGAFWNGQAEGRSTALTVKWSRDNGSISYLATLGSETATLLRRWSDESSAICVDDWVELMRPEDESGILVKVSDVSDDNGVLTIKFGIPKETKPPSGDQSLTLRQGDTIVVRRLDHRHRKNLPLWNGGILVVEETDKVVSDAVRATNKLDVSDRISVEVPLEDGVNVRLVLPEGAEFLSRDYWQIPARSATHDILWRRNAGVIAPEPHLKNQFVPATYTTHHYAPIAWIGKDGKVADLRRTVAPIA